MTTLKWQVKQRLYPEIEIEKLEEEEEEEEDEEEEISSKNLKF